MTFGLSRLVNFSFPRQGPFGVGALFVAKKQKRPIHDLLFKETYQRPEYTLDIFSLVFTPKERIMAALKISLNEAKEKGIGKGPKEGSEKFV